MRLSVGDWEERAPRARTGGASTRRTSAAKGYVPWQNSADYITWVFGNCASKVVARRPLSGTVLEIGPGGNVGCALLFLNAGAERAICIDVFPFLSDQADLYAKLVPESEALLERLDYRCPEEIETTRMADESCDIIFSSACLEHVADPAAAVKRIAALLRSGGVTTHGIDLRDHRDFDQPLRFLRHPQLGMESGIVPADLHQSLESVRLARGVRGIRAHERRG